MSILSKIAPVWAAKRAAARLRAARYEKVLARYEGASTSKRMGGWTPVTGASAVQETGPALSILRERSRDLVRNTWVGKRAISVLANNVVGTGIRPNCEGDSLAERMIKAWARSTGCDLDGVNNFYGLQRLIYTTMCVSGEALVVKYPAQYRPGKIPVQLRVLEPDYLNHTLTQELSGGRKIVQGVEFDSRGVRLAYHLFDVHPGARKGFERKTTRVPAEDVVHLFEAERPGQVRGVPIFAPVLVRMRDWEDFEDAQLQRQKIASCFTAFVRSPSGSPLEGIGAGDDDTSLSTHLMPGVIQLLEPGEDVTFGQPPDVGGYQDFAWVTLHELAAGLGISYEALTGDLSRVNFSSARMGWLEFQRRIDVDRRLILEPRLLRKVTGWLVEALDLMGIKLTADVVWTPPRRELIDPTREIPAMQQAVRMGFKSLSEVILETGRDPEDVFEQQARDYKKLDELGLVLDSDPRADISRVVQDNDPDFKAQIAKARKMLGYKEKVKV